MTGTPLLELRGISKSFGSVQALDDVQGVFEYIVAMRQTLGDAAHGVHLRQDQRQQSKCIQRAKCRVWAWPAEHRHQFVAHTLRR